LNGLHFRRQQIIKGFNVDCYCNAASVVVEVDGEVHDKKKAEDELRDRLMNEMGLYVLRINQ
jgi:very-short-patch-repair endonuclease